MRTARFCFAAALTFAVIGPASADLNKTFELTPEPQQIEGIDRRTFKIPLEPGATFEDAIRVANRTDQPLDLAIYASDARAGTDGAISVGFRGTTPEGVGAWIKVSRDGVSLQPRETITVKFQVHVASSDPSPDFGAIVVENTARDLRADLAERLYLVVRTAPPNSPTASIRVRPLLLRSPWIIVAAVGLVAAIALILVGARRARRHAEPSDDTADVDPTPTSRPALKRLGRSRSDELPSRPAPRPRPDEPKKRKARERKQPQTDDEETRPRLRDAFVTLDDDPPRSEPLPDDTDTTIPSVPEATAEDDEGEELGYIPLGDL